MSARCWSRQAHRSASPPSTSSKRTGNIRNPKEASVNASFEEYCDRLSKGDGPVSFAAISSFKYQIPDEAGLYVWGSQRRVSGEKAFIFRYVGKSETRPLNVRIVNWSGKYQRAVGRYIAGPKGANSEIPEQCTLAIQYYPQICGAFSRLARERYDPPLLKRVTQEAFPSCLADKFQQKVRQKTRLWHAVDWALHGGEGLHALWVAFLPESHELLKGTTCLACAETDLTIACNTWNAKHGYPKLLNKRKHTHKTQNLTS